MVHSHQRDVDTSLGYRLEDGAIVVSSSLAQIIRRGFKALTWGFTQEPPMPAAAT